MALIENANGLTAEQLLQRFRDMTDGELQAQELIQKGAIHALMFLHNQGASPQLVAQMLESGQRIGSLVTAEVNRRGLVAIDMPGAG